LVSFAGPVAHENIEPGFKPAGEALRDLDGFVQRVFVGADSVHLGLGAFEGEVGMQLDHGSRGRDHLGAVDLHFVIALGAERGWQKE
jgi:hypothetical protein